MNPRKTELEDLGSREPNARSQGLDFIRSIITEDVRTGKHGGLVVTRFPPEPNGFLHIGHAKSICLNYGVAAEFAGACNLRFDDTNPLTEDMRYVEAIQQDVRWLGFDWDDRLYFASDYFERLYDYAVILIERGKAYVDSSTDEEIREFRGTVTEPGRESPYRQRSVEENCDLFARMRDGEFPDGSHVLRAKIDMAHPNMLMRDPVLYRIRHASHYRRGDEWCIYPLYDFTHCLSDSIEGITHSLCTLEFKDNRELYDWVLDETQVDCHPQQIEFARLNLQYTVLSKRKLVELVQKGHVSGWDDPRLPTIAGLRRRGVTPEAIRRFADLIGVAKVDSRVDIEKLEYCIRDDLNQRVPRVMAVLRPLKVVIVNLPEEQVEELDAPYYPHDIPKEGFRKIPFSRVLYIERDDFREDPPKGFFRLAPGREVRLRYGYFITCCDVVKDPATGDVVEVHCTYDPATRGGDAPDGRKVKGTVHWVSAAHALLCEIRLYDRLFSQPNPEEVEPGQHFTDSLNPESLVVLCKGRVEPSVARDPPGTRYQFERQGYFCTDVADSGPGALVFNRTVSLRDTWAKVQAKEAVRAKGTKRQATTPATAPRRGAARGDGNRRKPAAQRSRRTVDLSGLGLAPEQTEKLSGDPGIARLFDEALRTYSNPKALASWVTNELVRESKGRPVDELPLTGAALGSLVALVEQGTISRPAAKRVFAEMVQSGGDPVEIVKRDNLEQLSDARAVEPVVRRVVGAYPDKVAAYHSGKTGLLGFFVGQVMKETGGRANPEVVTALLREALG
jgi:glutaminyl-tRNA synthetase